MRSRMGLRYLTKTRRYLQSVERTKRKQIPQLSRLSPLPNLHYQVLDNHSSSYLYTVVSNVSSSDDKLVFILKNSDYLNCRYLKNVWTILSSANITMSQSKPFSRQKIMNTCVTCLSLIVGGGECLLCCSASSNNKHSNTTQFPNTPTCIATKHVWWDVWLVTSCVGHSHITHTHYMLHVRC